MTFPLAKEIQYTINSNTTTLDILLNDYINIKTFGAKGDNSTNDTNAFINAITFAKTNNKKIIIPNGTYILTSGSINFAANNLTIIGEGMPTLKFVGTGRGFVLDTELSNGNVFYNMRVENLMIVGNADISDGFYSRGIVRSIFNNIEVRECYGIAFNILHGVSNTYNLKYSGNVGDPITQPVRGLVLNNNGTGYYTADCTFINTIMEAFSSGAGLYIEDGSGNTFLGGTFEGVNIGLTIASGCRRNKFDSVWMEANITNDAEIGGQLNSFCNCYFGSSGATDSNVEITSGEATTFIGGYVRTANLQSASKNTSFVGVGLDQNLSGTLGITGTGNYKLIGCSKINGTENVSGIMSDIIGEGDTWVPSITQGVNVTRTVNQAEYRKTGNIVNLRCILTSTSGGSSSNALLIGNIPTNILPKLSQVGNTVGIGTLKIAGVYNNVSVRFQSQTQISFIINGATSIYGINPTTAISSSDVIEFSINYEV